MAVEPAVHAAATVTLAWPKAGLVTAAAQPFVGDLSLADISIPAAVYRAVGVEPGLLFARGPLVRIRPLGDGWELIASQDELPSRPAWRRARPVAITAPANRDGRMEAP